MNNSKGYDMVHLPIIYFLFVVEKYGVTPGLINFASGYKNNITHC